MDQNAFLKLCEQMTNAELSREYKLPIGTILDRKKALREEGHEVGRGGFPESFTADYSQKIVTLKADSFLVIGDVEVPDHAADLLESAVDLGEHHGIDTIIINGDLITVDSFSKWRKAFADQLTFQQELDPLREILNTFLKRFKHVYYLFGNHERRVAHATEGQINIGQFLRPAEFPGLTWTPFAYVYVESCSGKWLVTHQDNYRSVSLSAPRAIFETELCHVICAHLHRLAISRDKSNQFWLIEGGHCRSPERTLYKVSRKNHHPKWNQGFVMIIDGVPWLVDRNNYHQFLNGIIHY